MEFITLFGIFATLILSIYNFWANRILMKKDELSKDQKICFNVIQIMAGNVIKNKNKENKEQDLLLLIKKYVETTYPEYKNEINIFENVAIWLFHKMRSAFMSKRIHNILLYSQQRRYNNEMVGKDELITYSLLYKEIYNDYKNIKINDLDYLRFAINDLNEKEIRKDTKKLKTIYGLTFRGKVRLFKKYIRNLF